MATDEGQGDALGGALKKPGFRRKQFEWRVLWETGFRRNLWRYIWVGPWILLPAMLVFAAALGLSLWLGDVTGDGSKERGRRAEFHGSVGAMEIGAESINREPTCRGGERESTAQTEIRVPAVTIVGTLQKGRLASEPESGRVGRLTESLHGETFKVFLLLGALCLGLLRWTASREEAGMDRYLEHRRAVNEMIEKSARDSLDDSQERVRLKVSGDKILQLVSGATKGEGPISREDLFVYSELDILELAFLKYRRGLMTTQAAFRALAVMRSRCEEELFSTKASTLVSEGNYTAGFSGVIEKICEPSTGESPGEFPDKGDEGSVSGERIS